VHTLTTKFAFPSRGVGCIELIASSTQVAQLRTAEKPRTRLLGLPQTPRLVASRGSARPRLGAGAAGALARPDLGGGKSLRTAARVEAAAARPARRPGPRELTQPEVLNEPANQCAGGARACDHSQRGGVPGGGAQPARAQLCLPTGARLPAGRSAHRPAAGLPGAVRRALCAAAGGAAALLAGGSRGCGHLARGAAGARKGEVLDGPDPPRRRPRQLPSLVL